MTATVRRPPAPRPAPTGVGWPAAPTAPPPADLAPERRALVEELCRRAGTSGTRTLVVGEPGIGKTTVLETALAVARADGTVVLDARPSGAGGDPFSGLIDLLGDVGDRRLAALPPVQRTAVDVALARRSVDRPLPATALRTAVATLVHDLLGEGPVCLAVDDWPELDGETAAVVRHVLTRPSRQGRAPSLLATQRVQGVLSGARDRVDEELFRPPDVLSVPPLSPDSLDDLVAARTGHRWNRVVVEEVHRVTRGNPLWATELTHPLLGDLVSASADVGPPASLTDVLAARMADLGTGARRTAAVVAVLGPVPPDALASLVGDGGAGLPEAVAAGVLRRTDRGVELVHPLLGAAALETVGDDERRTLHRLAADAASSAAQRAHHLDRAVLPGPDEGVAAALDAAVTETRAQGATAAALAHAELAVRRSEPGSAEHDRRVVTVAGTAFAAGDLDRVAELLAGLPLQLLPIGQLDRALPLLVEALVVRRGEGRAHEELARLADATAGRRLTGAVLDAYRAEDGTRSMEDRHRRVESAIAVLSAAGGAPSTLHRALVTLAQLRLDQGQGLDRALLARATALEETLPLVSVLDSAEAVLAVTAFQVDDVQTSLELLERLVDDATAAGEDAAAGFLGFHLALAALLAGDTARAGSLVDALADSGPWAEAAPPFVVRARGMLAVTLGSAEMLDGVLAHDGLAGSAAVQAWTRSALRGIADARDGRWAAALPSLERARRLADEAGVRDPGRRLWLDAELVEALCALGRVEEAEQAGARLDEVSRRGGRPLATGLHLRGAGLVAAARGDLPGAQRLLEESVEVLAPTGYPGQHARSLLELGRLLRRRGARTRAAALVAEARATAVATGDVPLSRRAGQLLATAPARAGSGSLQLTRAEERVAAAVAAGASNREIAAAQFVSVRTVESHLSSVYRKLGVTSRTRLARVLAEQEGGARRTGT